jgi:GTP pyrophosphokinase
MHDWAERGLAASFHYHEQKGTKGYTRKKSAVHLPAEMQWITQMQEVAAQLREGEEFSHEQLTVDLFKNRIFVYSPKGDIYNLPEGALPLDFAYLVHSDIGKHTYGFRVNGKIHAFDKPLRNGDVVEVIGRKLAQPKSDWQDLVTTTHARAKLRMQLRKLGLLQAVSGAAAIIREKAARKKTKK